MQSPFPIALRRYKERFGTPPLDIADLLTGQSRRLSETVSGLDAALFLLATAASQGWPVALFAPLMNMCRLEWRLQELGAPEGSVTYLHQAAPYVPAEFGLVYRLPIQPTLVSWPIFIR